MRAGGSESGSFGDGLGQPEERNEAAMADEDRTIPLIGVYRLRPAKVGDGFLASAQRLEDVPACVQGGGMVGSQLQGPLYARHPALPCLP